MRIVNAPVPPAPGKDFPKLVDHLGQVVILTPVGERTVETEHGTAEVMDASASVYNAATGKVEPVGTVSVFWAAVRAQLASALAAGDTVVGRLSKEGRRYILQPVDGEILTAISKHLGDF